MLLAPLAVVASGRRQPSGPGADIHHEAEHNQGKEGRDPVTQDRKLGAGSGTRKASRSDVPGQTKQRERSKREQRVPFRAEGQAKAEPSGNAPGSQYQGWSEPTTEIGNLALLEIARQAVSEPFPIGDEAGNGSH